jgi:hypothetical protein
MDTSPVTKKEENSPETDSDTDDNEHYEEASTINKFSVQETQVVPSQPPPANSTHIHPGSTLMNIRDLSIIKGMSRVFDFAWNLSKFNLTQNNITQVNLDVSVESAIPEISNLSEVSLTFSPKKLKDHPSTNEVKEPEDEDIGREDKQTSPLFLTPPSRSPVNRKCVSREQASLDDISPIQFKIRTRVRTKSESSCRRNPYQVPTPTDLLRRKMKERVKQGRSAAPSETPTSGTETSSTAPSETPTSSTAPSETPTSRRRCNSEPSSGYLHQTPEKNLNASFSLGNFTCTRITEGGKYRCGNEANGYIHLENDFLKNTIPFRLSKSTISSAIERTLSLSAENRLTDDPNQTVTITFCAEDVDEVTRISTQDNHPTSQIEENILLYLLGKMNRHMTRTTNCEQSFNGLKITCMSDRSKRMNMDDDSEDSYPLGILHIGKSRGLNLTPKRHTKLPTDICDIELKNWSFLTISAMTRETMSPYLAPESRLEGHVPDYHVIITPCFSEGWCTFPTPLCHRNSEREDMKVQEDVKKTSSTSLELSVLHKDDLTSAKKKIIVQEDLRKPPSTSLETYEFQNNERNSEREDDLQKISATSLEPSIPYKAEMSSEKTETIAQEDVKKTSSACPNLESSEHQNNERNSEREEMMAQEEVKTALPTNLQNKSKEELDNTKPPEKVVKHTHQGVFLSEEVCIKIVNHSANNKNLIKWCKQCGIPADLKNAHINRVAVLDFIDKIIECKASPPEPFVTSLIEKIVAESIDAELDRFGIRPKGKSKAGTKKKLLREFIIKNQVEPSVPTVSKENDNHKEDIPPEFELDSSSSSEGELESSSSWAESDNDRDLKRSVRPKSAKLEPKSTKVVDRRKKTAQKKCPDVNSVKEASRKDLSKKVTPTKTRETNENPSKTETQIKNLEKTLLDFQARISNQEIMIKSLTESRNLKSPEPKTLKSLESKIKTIFDNLNLQQNSIDDITDRLSASAKDKKRTNDQISQIHSLSLQNKGQQDETINRLSSQVNSLVQRNSQYDHLLSELKAEMGQIVHQVSQITGELMNLKNEISSHKTENRIFSEEDHRSEQQAFERDCFLSEIREMKRENRVQFDAIRSLLKELKPAANNTGTLDLDLQEMKRENRIRFDEIRNLLKELKPAECKTGTPDLRASEANKTPTLVTNLGNDAQHIVTKTESQPPKHTINQTNIGDYVNSLTNDQGSKVSEPATANENRTRRDSIKRKAPESSPGKESSVKNPKVNDKSVKQIKKVISQELKENTSKETVPETEEKQQPRESYRRESYRSDSRGYDTQPKQTYRKDSARNTKNDQNSDMSIDTSFYKRREAKKDRYRTKKCLVIHDPYFDKFDNSKFSKWFDISTIRYETLQAAKSDKSLYAKIDKICPEVIYIHVGQADLLNKTPGNKVVQDMKDMIHNLEEKTSCKICISLIIPLETIPQVKSVISQVNTKVGNFITELRRKYNGEDRIFTQDNDVLGNFIRQSTGSHGIVVSLNDHGQKKLWLHLKDGLTRSTEQTVHSNTTGQGSRNDVKRKNTSNE